MTTPYVPEESEMNDAQARTFQEINDSWPIDTWEFDEDDAVRFVCDDGDEGIIDLDGQWDWTNRA